MTLLDCVNTCLSRLGEARVTSTDVRHPTVDLIKETVHLKRRELLERGWWFNQAAVTMYPSTAGTMAYPVDSLSILGFNGKTFVARDGMLFDLDNNTTLFSGPEKLLVTYDVDFDDLPECAANVVMYRAGQEVYAGDLGIDKTVQDMQLREAQNYQTLEMLHLRNKRFSTRQRRGFRRIQSALMN